MNQRLEEARANASIPYDRYQQEFQQSYEKAPYYRDGQSWQDYEPAYKYGYDQYASATGRKWEEVKSELEQGWDKAKGESRMAWEQAKDAVRAGWDRVERAMPGDADNDGR